MGICSGPSIYDIRARTLSSMLFKSVSVFYFLENDDQTTCLDRVMRNQKRRRTHSINKRFKREKKKCDKFPKFRIECRQKAAASKKERLKTIIIDYVAVGERCTDVCFESGELKKAFDAYTQ